MSVPLGVCCKRLALLPIEKYQMVGLPDEKLWIIITCSLTSNVHFGVGIQNARVGTHAVLLGRSCLYLEQHCIRSRVYQPHVGCMALLKDPWKINWKNKRHCLYFKGSELWSLYRYRCHSAKFLVRLPSGRLFVDYLLSVIYYELYDFLGP